MCVNRRSLGHASAHCDKQLKSPKSICHMRVPGLFSMMTGVCATCGGVKTTGAPPSAPPAACRGGRPWPRVPPQAPPRAPPLPSPQPPCQPAFHSLPPLPALPPSHLSPFLLGSAGLHGSPSHHGSPRHPWPHGVFVASFCEDCIAMATTASEHQRWRVAGWLRQPPTLPLPPPLQPLQQLPPPPTLPLPMP